ncbi:MAG TPA: hypothetical protein VIZ65_08670 [Cellvibrionaceae bacterium]
MKYFSLILLIISFCANAGNYTCTGKIDAINQPFNGEVIINSTQLFGNGAGRTICNLTAPYTRANTVQPETCKAWLAKLLAAHARQIPIVLQYNDSVAGQSCASQQN